MSDKQQDGILVSECEVDKRASNTVLIAEDDPICRRVLQNRLANWGYRVITTVDGLEAWGDPSTSQRPRFPYSRLDDARYRWPRTLSQNS